MKNPKKVRVRASSDSEKIADFDKLQRLYDKIKLENPNKNILSMLDSETFIPTSIFSKELSCLETISKYLVENLGLSLNKIAELTNRTNKNIWYAYNQSKQKNAGKFIVKDFSNSIPLSIISDLKLGVLENIVYYLRNELSLSYHKIGIMLGRDERTIWTVNSKAVMKKK